MTYTYIYLYVIARVKAGLTVLVIAIIDLLVKIAPVTSYIPVPSYVTESPVYKEGVEVVWSVAIDTVVDAAEGLREETDEAKEAAEVAEEIVVTFVVLASETSEAEEIDEWLVPINICM